MIIVIRRTIRFFSPFVFFCKFCITICYLKSFFNTFLPKRNRLSCFANNIVLLNSNKINNDLTVKNFFCNLVPHNCSIDYSITMTFFLVNTHPIRNHHIPCTVSFYVDGKCAAIPRNKIWLFRKCTRQFCCQQFPRLIVVTTSSKSEYSSYYKEQ